MRITAATNYTRVWFIWQRRRIVTDKPIAAPFIYVSAHIVDAQFIRLLESDIVRSGITVVAIPCHRIYTITTSILIATTFITSTGSIFPLSLCGQTELTASQLVQLPDKPLTIIKRHFYYWTIVAFVMRRCATHHRFPQFLRHLCLPYIVVAKSHLMCSVGFSQSSASPTCSEVAPIVNVPPSTGTIVNLTPLTSYVCEPLTETNCGIGSTCVP